jgi:hypothetical protein
VFFSAGYFWHLFSVKEQYRLETASSFPESGAHSQVETQNDLSICGGIYIIIFSDKFVNRGNMFTYLELW